MFLGHGKIYAQVNKDVLQSARIVETGYYIMSILNVG